MMMMMMMMMVVVVMRTDTGSRTQPEEVLRIRRKTMLFSGLVYGTLFWVVSEILIALLLLYLESCDFLPQLLTCKEVRIRPIDMILFQ